MIRIILFINFTMVFGVNAQTDISHILKTYPDWKTNFSKSLVRFDELMAGGPPKDGIPAILNPKFETPGEAAKWLDEKEPLILVINGKSVKGYPLQVLLWHELVNDQINDVPILISFCPLCYSAIVFDRKIGKTVLTFGVSGLLRNSDLIMYDFSTESFWQQFTGEAIVGDFAGTKLNILQSQIISFEDFWNNFPYGRILSRKTGYNRKYGNSPYLGYDNPSAKPFMFRGEFNKNIPLNEKVVGIKIGNLSKAYPYTITKHKKVINDNVNGQPVVIFHKTGTYSVMDQIVISQSKDIGSTAVFNRLIDGKVLHFYFSKGKFYDKETGSTWNILGRATSGKYLGMQLNKIISGDYFAFAWFAFNPESELFKN